MSSSPDNWDSLVYPQRKTVCYVASGVYIYYLFALGILVIFWRYVNSRTKMFTTIVLIFGSTQYSFVQILCYVDYLVTIDRCHIYTRFITILADLTDLTFDIYQIRRILPLLGSTLQNPTPWTILSYFLYLVRMGCFIAKNIIQTTVLNAPVGGFRDPNIGICANFIDSSILVAIRCGSFAFQFVLFGELMYIIYRLRTDSRNVLEQSNARITANQSIGRLFDIELGLFVFYFSMDTFFLIVLLIPNTGPYIPYGTVYNAVLPTFVIANVLSGRWVAKKRELKSTETRPTVQSTSPTEQTSQVYILTESFANSKIQHIRSSGDTKNGGHLPILEITSPIGLQSQLGSNHQS